MLVAREKHRQTLRTERREKKAFLKRLESVDKVVRDLQDKILTSQVDTLDLFEAGLRFSLETRAWKKAVVVLVVRWRGSRAKPARPCLCGRLLSECVKWCLWLWKLLIMRSQSMSLTQRPLL